MFALAILSSYCAGQAAASRGVPASGAMEGGGDQRQRRRLAGALQQQSSGAGGHRRRRVQRDFGSRFLDRPQSAPHEADYHSVGIAAGGRAAGVFQAEFLAKAGPAGQTLYVTEGQLWQKQGGQWRIVGTKRTDTTKLQQPASTSKVIYAPGLDAHAEIKQALELAAKGHKRVLVVFGANWCYDCHVLDLAFHRPDVAGVLQQNFEVVHVDVGEGDKNQDIMQQYQVPMKHGIPAVAVLDSNGKLLYSQKGGEFERARALAPEDVLQFLNKWKPVAR